MEEKLDLRDTLAVLQRRWRLIAGFMVCGLALAVAFLLAVTPKYSAEATLKFDPRQFQITSSNASLGNDLFDRLIAGEIAAVRSPDVLRTVMTSLKLWDDPELTEPTLYEMIAGPIGNLLSPGGPRLLDPELRPLANFEKRLWVDQPDKTNLITISYESLDRAKAPAVANAIANTYLAYHLEHQLGDSPLAAKWLNERRAELREQWRRSEQLLEQYKAENNLSYVGGENLKDQQMARVNEQLVLANAAAEEARARVEQIRRLMDSRNYTQLANAVKSELMTLLRDRLAAASQKQASLGATLLPAHPSMREVQSEVASLNADILAEARRTLENLEYEYRTATEREQLVTASLQRTIGSVQASGDKLVKLRELERNAASDKTIYEAFLNRSNEALEQSTGQFVNFRLIKKAEAPVRPSFPSKVKVLLLALAGSIGAGIGGAFLLEMLATGIRTGRDVAEQLHLPHLASLPPIDADGPSPRARERAVVFAPEVPFARTMASLRAGLPFVFPASQVIAVTSALEGEGKTLVAASLAQDAALTGVRTLLIDGNYRHPALARVFGINGAPASALRGADWVDVDMPVVMDETTGLDILRLPATPTSSPDLVRSREFRDLLAAARRAYQLVVVDTAAVRSSPETWFLAAEADATLLVVTWDRTPREAVADALDTLRRCHVTSIGIVINRAQGGEQGWLRAGPARETGRAFAAGPAAAGRPAWQSGTAPDAKAGSDPKWM